MNWIIVPVRNGLEYTKAALPTFFKQDIGNVSVLLIDNDSTDGTGEWARAYQSISYWHNRPPKSVAASWNSALSLIFGTPGNEYALVSNNDVALRPDTYRHLVADGGLFVTAVGHSDKSAIAPNYYTKGQVCRGSDLPYRDPDPAMKRPHPDFSCFLIRRECWKRVGKFDEGYIGGYCEDADYHIRMHKAGIKAESLEMPFYHAASGTIKTASPEEQKAIQDRAQRNREYFKKKWGVAIGSPEYYNLFGHDAPEVVESASCEQS